ncbi:MAG: hypothetical protein PGN13_16200 [Patulibacter minatonensis]
MPEFLVSWEADVPPLLGGGRQEVVSAAGHRKMQQQLHAAQARLAEVEKTLAGPGASPDLSRSDAGSAGADGSKFDAARVLRALLLATWDHATDEYEEPDGFAVDDIPERFTYTYGLPSGEYATDVTGPGREFIQQVMNELAAAAPAGGAEDDPRAWSLDRFKVEQWAHAAGWRTEAGDAVVRVVDGNATVLESDDWRGLVAEIMHEDGGNYWLEPGSAETESAEAVLTRVLVDASHESIEDALEAAGYVAQALREEGYELRRRSTAPPAPAPVPEAEGEQENGNV